MKRIMLTMVVIILRLTSVNAQADTTIVKSAMESPGLQPDQHNKGDRAAVKSTDIPASLKRTLKRNKSYNGWQNVTIYRDKSTNNYYLDLSSGNTSRTYYFDQQGRPVPENTSTLISTGPSYNSSGDPNIPAPSAIQSDGTVNTNDPSNSVNSPTSESKSLPK